MLKYIGKRLVIGALTLLILSTITFFGVRAMPGDPFSQDNKVIAPETYEAMRAKFHLDKSLPEQYIIFLSNAIRGDFGESISKKGKQVSEIIALRFPVTAKLGAIAFCVSMVLGLLAGIPIVDQKTPDGATVSGLASVIGAGFSGTFSSIS